MRDTVAGVGEFHGENTGTQTIFETAHDFGGVDVSVRETASAVGAVGLADDEHVLQMGVVDLVAHSLKDFGNGVGVGIDQDVAVVVVEPHCITAGHIKQFAAGIDKVMEIGVVGFKGDEHTQLLSFCADDFQTGGGAFIVPFIGGGAAVVGVIGPDHAFGLDVAGEKVHDFGAALSGSPVEELKVSRFISFDIIGIAPAVFDASAEDDLHFGMGAFPCGDEILILFLGHIIVTVFPAQFDTVVTGSDGEVKKFLKAAFAFKIIDMEKSFHNISCPFVGSCSITIQLKYNPASGQIQEADHFIYIKRMT